ncbi:MAG: lysophospholipase [Desulfobacter sp.]|nr:MAG: lysophospholipase [Desulfobacter sp.]
MAAENGYFKGPEGIDYFYQCWLPESSPRAALIVVHGLAEHGGRYMNLVNSMVPRGFAVYAPDHYGHGKSGGRRLFVPDFNVFTQALDLFVDKVKDWEPGRPVFLVGHSMGGLIVAAYLQARQHKVDGALLSGPAVKVPGHVTPLTRTAAGLFSRVAPTLGIRRLDATDISRDPEVVAAYINDPLVSTGKITARLASQMLDACDRAMEGAGGISLPLLVLQGGGDALVDPDGTAEFHEAAGSTDKKFILYPDRFHEIFNDPDHETVFKDMADWLEKRLEG